MILLSNDTVVQAQCKQLVEKCGQFWLILPKAKALVLTTVELPPKPIE